MQSLILDAQIREVFGKKLNAIRKDGLVPAELYGQGVKNVSLQVKLRDLEKVYKEAGENTIVKIKIKDDKAVDRNVLIYDIVREPISQRIIHADFFQVRMDQAIKTAVPLEFTGESSAVKSEGGILVKNLHEVEVEALPADLPREITVDVSSLNKFDDAILVKNLPVPPKVKILADPELMVVQVQAPRSEAELEALKEEVVEKIEEVKVETEEKKAEKEKEGEEKGEAAK